MASQLPAVKPLYSPLGPSEIRLLTLLPGDPDDRTIRCTLKHATLQIESARDIQYWRLQESLSRSKSRRLLRRWSRVGQPVYEALSYCWGRDEVYDSIGIDGSQIPIARNLWLALYHLRHPTGGKRRVLWVDALCVNQSDLTERSKQVAIMYAIYNRASEVIVWLGEKYEESDYAIEAFADTTEFEPERAFRPETQRAILSLYNRPYWGRLWILQEVCLATRIRVYCGTRSITWDQFNHFWMHFRYSILPDKQQSLQRHYVLPESLEKLMDMMHRRTCFAGMLQLLQVSRHLQCWDVRDRVYGLLGMLHQRVGTEPLEADYSISPQQLYVEVMEWYIRNEPHLMDDVLPMSQVLQEALGHPFLQYSEIDASVRDWKSGPSHTRSGVMAWALDRVTYVGSLLQAQQSPGGRSLELQIVHQIDRKRSWDVLDDGARRLDTRILQLRSRTGLVRGPRPSQVVYRQGHEEKDRLQRVLDSEGKCCALVTVRGEVFLGPTDVKKGDGLYYINKKGQKHVRILRLGENSSINYQKGANSSNIDSNILKVVGQVLPFEELGETAFIQELRKAAEPLVNDSKQPMPSDLHLTIRDIQLLTARMDE